MAVLFDDANRVATYAPPKKIRNAALRKKAKEDTELHKLSIC